MVDIPLEQEEGFSACLFELGTSGIETKERENLSCLTAYFPGKTHPDTVVAALRSLHASLSNTRSDVPAHDLRISVDGVPDKDWSSAWREHFKPVYPTPSLVICPPWNPVGPPPNGFSVVIEPKMAFGTGHHETTSLALNLIEDSICAGDTVLDAGSGSGILAIAAAKWGASRVTGIDIDPLATECARENLELNELTGAISLITGTIEPGTGEYDVVVANMISSILSPLLPCLASHLKDPGILVLSGLLDREEEAFLRRIEEADLEHLDVRQDGCWLGIRAQKAGR